MKLDTAGSFSVTLNMY